MINNKVKTALIETCINNIFNEHAIANEEHLYDIYDESSRCLNYTYNGILSDMYDSRVSANMAGGEEENLC